MTRRIDSGNGDQCPIYPDHGRMFALTPMPGRPPKQYCSHVDHDGRKGESPLPRTRAVWPLHGFEESVVAYRVRFTDLPDLSDLEVADGDNA